MAHGVCARAAQSRSSSRRGSTDSSRIRSRRYRVVRSIYSLPPPLHTAHPVSRRCRHAAANISTHCTSVIAERRLMLPLVVSCPRRDRADMQRVRHGKWCRGGLCWGSADCRRCWRERERYNGIGLYRSRCPSVGCFQANSRSAAEDSADWSRFSCGTGSGWLLRFFGLVHFVWETRVCGVKRIMDVFAMTRFGEVVGPLCVRRACKIGSRVFSGVRRAFLLLANRFALLV